MAREIKFRSWDEETKEMSYDFLSKNWLMVCIKSPFVELMQYTGCKDKKGKEIYEGDILDHRTYVHSDLGRQGIVCFDSMQCKYKLVPQDVYDINAGNGGFSGYAFDYQIALESEIVGNIYEKAVTE